jgi:hypothetical protein
MSTSSEIKYIVKVADFGLSRSMEGKEYYTSSNVAIPVKWTARMYYSIEDCIDIYISSVQNRSRLQSLILCIPRSH